MKDSENRQTLRKHLTCGILNMQNQAILCPNCRRKIRGVRVPPGGEMHGISVQCHDCRAKIIVNIDQASATYTSPRR